MAKGVAQTQNELANEIRAARRWSNELDADLDKRLTAAGKKISGFRCNLIRNHSRKLFVQLLQDEVCDSDGRVNSTGIEMMFSVESFKAITSWFLSHVGETANVEGESTPG